MENVLDLMNNLHNKFIFMQTGKEDQEFVDRVDELGTVITSVAGMDIKGYHIDLRDRESREALVEYLQARPGSEITERTLMEHSFLLGNRFNDVWPHEAGLLDVFQREVAYFQKFFAGPRFVLDLDYILCAQSGWNDLHIVSYIENERDLEQLQATKQSRKLN